MKRDIHIIINKSEITAGTRGASLGPEAMMTAARKDNNLFFGRYSKSILPTVNYLLDEDVKYPSAKRIEGLVQVFDRVSSEVQEVLSENKFPLLIAADHGSAGGTIAGIKATYPDKKLGVLWIDAHGDLHTPYTTPSGNMHGMPLSTALGQDNIKCAVKEPHKDVVSMWNDLKNCGVEGAKLLPEDLVFIGVRDVEDQEVSLMNELNLKNHLVEEVREKGCEAIAKEIDQQLSDCDIIYISFDVDSMDPEYTSHGTGTPVDNGLTPDEARFFLEYFAEHKKTVCMEFVEVNPCLDEKTNKMAEVAFELFESTAKSLEK